MDRMDAVETEGPAIPSEHVAAQAEIDLVMPAEYVAHRDGPGDASAGGLPAALARYDAAFARVAREAENTDVADRPAVWHVYNMGLVVKTPKTLFSVDLCHRDAQKLAPRLDFALITHNHDDHYTMPFLACMNGAGKTVVSNFDANGGALRSGKGFGGGYTRAEKTFSFADVSVKTSLSDHNGYLVDFTTAFEIEVNGFRVYHTGDSGNVAKLNPAHAPDLWIVHPYCGLAVADGVRKFRPKKTVLAHLNELGHARGRWRWTYADGFRVAEQVRAAGGDAVVPLWGERLV